jgi:hypothetical protein
VKLEAALDDRTSQHVWYAAAINKSIKPWQQVVHIFLNRPGGRNAAEYEVRRELIVIYAIRPISGNALIRLAADTWDDIDDYFNSPNSIDPLDKLDHDAWE